MSISHPPHEAQGSSWKRLEPVAVAVGGKTDNTAAYRDSQQLRLCAQDLHKLQSQNPSMDGEGLIKSPPV